MFLGYVDPGLGALIWQAVVSAFVGLLFYLNKTRKAMVNFFLKIFGRDQKSEPTAKIPVSKIGTELDAER
jgi:hypothetical protein